MLLVYMITGTGSTQRGFVGACGMVVWGGTLLAGGPFLGQRQHQHQATAKFES